MQPAPLQFERPVFSKAVGASGGGGSQRAGPQSQATAKVTPMAPGGTAPQISQGPPARQILRIERWQITVATAPEPDDVIHENLETPIAERFCRQLMINSCMILLLVVSFAFIFAAHFAQTSYLETLPNFAVCTNDLPAIYWPGQELPDSAQIRRNRDLDSNCRNNGGTSVFLEWVASPEDSGAVALAQEGDFVGAPSTFVPAPVYSNTTLQAASAGPGCLSNQCVSTRSTDKCVLADETEVQRSTVLACYCYGRLTEAI